MTKKRFWNYKTICVSPEAHKEVSEFCGIKINIGAYVSEAILEKLEREKMKKGESPEIVFKKESAA